MSNAAEKIEVVDQSCCNAQKSNAMQIVVGTTNLGASVSGMIVGYPDSIVYDLTVEKVLIKILNGQRSHSVVSGMEIEELEKIAAQLISEKEVNNGSFKLQFINLDSIV